MKNYIFKWLIFIISTALIGLLSIQIYWNYKNYIQTQEVIHKDINRIFDGVMKTYYENEFSKMKKNEKKELNRNEKIIYLEKKENFRGSKKLKLIPNKLDFAKKMPDSTFIKQISRIIVELRFSDSLNIKRIDSLTKIAFKENYYDLKYKIFNDRKKYVKLDEDTLNVVKYKTSSNMEKNNDLYLKYEKPFNHIWKKSAFEFIISFFITLLLIIGFIWLFKIIQNQKKIDLTKNDFISNISHELKTPITVVGTAVESIKHFYLTHDSERTNKYLDIAAHHNKKLGVIVEKILETASLDAKQLNLKLEYINLSLFLENFLKNNELQFTHQTLTSKIDNKIYANIDVFHFENVIQNLYDNAQKYGGSEIFFRLYKNSSFLYLEIEDSGILNKKFDHEIFNKFYRIPKGNIHAVKGHGIGLYYVKKVIEKHQGQIEILHLPQTLFQIKLPINDKV